VVTEGVEPQSRVADVPAGNALEGSEKRIHRVLRERDGGTGLGRVRDESRGNGSQEVFNPGSAEGARGSPGRPHPRPLSRVRERGGLWAEPWLLAPGSRLLSPEP
jgi:hypothetical protein